MATSGETLKIHNARFILTVDTDRRIVRDGSILVRDGRIAEVGKASDMDSTPADRVIDASDMVITPGMLNGHAHISYAHATRGIFPDTLGPDYLPNVFRLQGELDEEAEYCASLLAIVEMLKGGTTCFMDPGSTKFLDACMDAYEQSGCRIIIGTHVTDKPNPVNLPQYETAEAISVMENTIRDYDHRLNDRVRAWAMPFDASYSTDEMLIAAKRLADEYGTGMTLHQTNGSSVVDEYIRNHGMRPIEYLDSLGILGENVLLSHVIGVDDAEMDVMARTGATTVMCPSQTLKQATGITRVGKLPELPGARDSGRTGDGRAEQLQPDGNDAGDVPGGGDLQRWAAGYEHDSAGDRAGACDDWRGGGIRNGRRHRLNRGRQEGGHGAVRHAAA